MRSAIAFFTLFVAANAATCGLNFGCDGLPYFGGCGSGIINTGLVGPARTIANTCTCTKTTVRPKYLQVVKDVPSVRRVVHNIATPVVEQQQYPAAPLDGGCGCGCGCGCGLAAPCGLASSCGLAAPCGLSSVSTCGPINACGQLNACGPINTCGLINGCGSINTCGQINACGPINTCGQINACGPINTCGQINACGPINTCGLVSSLGSCGCGLSAINGCGCGSCGLGSALGPYGVCGLDLINGIAA